MNYNLNSPEDKKWLSRLLDLANSCETKKTPKFTDFCDIHLLSIAKASLKDSFVLHSFWGGFDDSERQMVGFFPDYLEPDSSLFPISLLKIKGAKGSSHRDFLGSFLGLGITRDCIGDILVCDDSCFVFVHSKIAEFILYNLNKVGKNHVTVSLEEDLSVLPERKFEEIFGTVSSVRLDSIVSLFTKKSRGDSQDLISSERVFLNGVAVTNNSASLKTGDVISVRGFGKMRLGTLGPETKKGRIRVTLYKYV